MIIVKILICINKQLISELAILRDPGAWSRLQVKEGELEIYPRPLVLRLGELAQPVLIFHGYSFQ